MRRVVVTRLLLALSVPAVWLVAGEAHAQIDLGQLQDVARAKAEEGLGLFDAKRFQDAYDRFRVAEDLFHAPTLVLHMAHCQRELGHLLAARGLYRKVAEEAMPADAPDAFVQAVTTAKQEKDALDARIPRISIALRGEGAERARITLDGGPVAALHPAEVEIDPGTHLVGAYAKGAEPAELEIDVKEGARRRIDLELQKLKPPPPPEPGSLVPGGVTFGAGLAWIAIGAITGGVVLSRVNDLKENCNGTLCPDTLRSEAEDLGPIASASNASFVIGGLAAATGVVLMIVRPGGTDGGERADAALRVELGPTGFSLGGAF